ncbi:MAG: hypothetical protein U0457_19175 [Candidatus Sericytochromatia bacterium]
MDNIRDLLDLVSASIKEILEEKLEAKFSLGKIKTIETNKLISDICFNFTIVRKDKKQELFYFLDRKIMLNLIKHFSEQLNNLDFNTDFLLSVIQEFNIFLFDQKLNNFIIKKKTIDKSDEYQFLKISILKGHEHIISEQNIIFKSYFLSSNKGDFIVAIPLEYQKNTEKKEIKQSIKDQSQAVLSAVQMIEMKKNILTSINEIKDLRGDGDFLLRKAKIINDLTNTLFEITKEENK